MTTGKIQGMQVAEVMGWRKHDDGSMAVVGLKAPSGDQLYLGCPAEQLWNATVCFIDANAAFPVNTAVGSQSGLRSLDIASMSFARNNETGEVVLAVNRPNGATLPLRFSREGALSLRDALTEALAG